MTPLLADMGIPMIMLELPAMAILFVPVVLLESFVVNRSLGIGFSKAGSGLFLANLASTILGFPLAWIVMLGVELASGAAFMGVTHFFPAIEHVCFNSPILRIASVPFVAAWVPGDEAWQILIAAAVLLIPTFYISVWIERRICVWVWASEVSDTTSAVGKAVRKANVVSYVFLYAILVFYVVYQSVAHGSK
ncbi:MAG: hypothetical protein ABSA12_03540 [Verrucomicrobiia bacterium]|jgi:hypothetical protein